MLCARSPLFGGTFARRVLARLGRNGIRPLSDSAVPSLIPAEQMPLALRRRVAGLESLHAEYEALEEHYQEQLKQLEQAFEQQSRMLFDRRQRIVDGLEEPTDADLQKSAYYAEFEDLVPSEDTMQGVDVIGVPAFWPTVFRHAQSLQPEAMDGFELSESDWAVLDHLVEVRMEPWEVQMEAMSFEGIDGLDGLDGMDGGMDGEGNEFGMQQDTGFALHFRFAPNTMLDTEEISLYCGPSGDVIESTPPMWADPSHDPTVKWISKKLRKKGGHVKRVSSPRPVESFFRIFAAGPNEDEEIDGLMPLMELQEELVIRLKEDVLPRAAMYYIQALHGFTDEDLDMSPADFAARFADGDGAPRPISRQ